MALKLEHDALAAQDRDDRRRINELSRMADELALPSSYGESFRDCRPNASIMSGSTQAESVAPGKHGQSFAIDKSRKEKLKSKQSYIDAY